MTTAQKSLAKVDKTGMKPMSSFFSPKVKTEKKWVFEKFRFSNKEKKIHLEFFPFNWEKIEYWTSSSPKWKKSLDNPVLYLSSVHVRDVLVPSFGNYRCSSFFPWNTLAHLQLSRKCVLNEPDLPLLQPIIILWNMFTCQYYEEILLPSDLRHTGNAFTAVGISLNCFFF